MNEAVRAESTQLIIPAKVSLLRVQSTILNSDINKDVINIIDRIRAIGNRLNSVNHPDNNSNKILGTVNGGLANTPEQIPTDGIERELNDLIGENQVFINNWNENLHPMLLKYVSYIESHI